VVRTLLPASHAKSLSRQLPRHFLNYVHSRVILSEVEAQPNAVEGPPDSEPRIKRSREFLLWRGSWRFDRTATPGRAKLCMMRIERARLQPCHKAPKRRRGFEPPKFNRAANTLVRTADQAT